MIGWLLASALAVSSPETDLPPVPPGQVMAIPPALQVMVQQQVIEPGRTPSQRLALLFKLMSSGETGLGMHYRDDATHTVAQAFDTRQANCLTYTLMFLALADAAGLDAMPQEIDQTLAWQQRGNVVYRSNHVNASVRIGVQRYLVDVGSSFVIARHPAHPISRQRLLAQYYNNRAVQLMGDARLDDALAHADIAIALDPTYPTTWSNTGVLRMRSDDIAGAEDAYRKALALDPMQSSALFNLVGLYHRSGDDRRAMQFRRRLEKVQSSDPFHQFMLAAEFEKQGDGTQAAKYYQRAIRLHAGEHRFYLGLARAHALTGNTRRARKALERALALAKDEDARAEYRSALKALQDGRQLQ
jgi:tetratricopeptide (TPR) repeat protein